MTAPQIDAQFQGRLREAFAAQLPLLLPQQRWFGSKARHIHSVQLAECIPMLLPQTTALITMARVEYTEGAGETYVLPLAPAEVSTEFAGGSLVVRVPQPESSSEIVLTDALSRHEFLSKMLESIQKRESLAGESGGIEAKAETILEKSGLGAATTLTPKLMKGEQSNTSVVYGGRLILKFFRRVEEGINPDLEMGHFLSEIAHYENVPPLCGSLEYRTKEEKSMTLGILQGFVANQGDAWRSTLQSLAELIAQAVNHEREGRASKSGKSAALHEGDLAREVREGLEKERELKGTLGKRTAELHLALASSRSDAAFAPEPFTPEVCESLGTSLHDLAVRNFELLRQKLGELPEPLLNAAKNVLKLEDHVLLTFHSELQKGIHSVRTRIHGDYHLGQVLFTGSDFFIIDFEGEPARPLSERRSKRSPLQDVAGMLRSFHYAAKTALLTAKEQVAEFSRFEPMVTELAARWQAQVSLQFLEEYKRTAGGAPFLPKAGEEFEGLLKLHLLEKAIYELGYELNNRPSWVVIPLSGIEETLGAKTSD